MAFRGKKQKKEEDVINGQTGRDIREAGLEG